LNARNPAVGGEPAAEEMVVMGAVSAPFGIQGWVKVRPHTGEPDALLGYAAWWVKAPHVDHWQQMELVAGKMHAGTLVAQLGGVAGRDAALALRGCAIGIPRSALPPAEPGEIYHSDLGGMAVVNRDGVVLGTVAGVTAHGAHPLLRVVRAAPGPGSERLIPLVPAIVVGIDAAAGRIEVDWGEDW
jgi:16S rRNA processing protein RimM